MLVLNASQYPFPEASAAHSREGLYFTVCEELSTVKKNERTEKGKFTRERKDGRKGGWTIERKVVRMDRRRGQMEGAEEKERGKYEKVMRHSF